MAQTYPAGGPGTPRWIGLRYTNVFGTGEESKGRMASIISQLLRQAAAGEDVELFSNTLLACRDYIPVEHVAITNLQLIDGPVRSGVYNLGSGHAISFATLVEWCAEFAGEPIRVRLSPNPMNDRYQFWTCADMSRLHAELPDRPLPTREDVHTAARALFGDFAAAGHVR